MLWQASFGEEREDQECFLLQFLPSPNCSSRPSLSENLWLGVRPTGIGHQFPALSPIAVGSGGACGMSRRETHVCPLPSTRRADDTGTTFQAHNPSSQSRACPLNPRDALERRANCAQVLGQPPRHPALEVTALLRPRLGAACVPEAPPHALPRTLRRRGSEAGRAPRGGKSGKEV